jgi:energy-coupling factor transport system substrate-specific component
MWFLLIIAARALGIELGYVIAIVAMTLSALITGGIGPWLPFQILIASWIALGVAVIPSNLTGKLEILTLSFYGFCVGLLYGALMDLQLWPWILGTDTQLSYQPGAAVSENLARFLTFHFATALAWDLPRAILNSLLIALTGSSVLFALRRANSRMSAVAQWRQINERAKAQTES